MLKDLEEFTRSEQKENFIKTSRKVVFLSAAPASGSDFPKLPIIPIWALSTDLQLDVNKSRKRAKKEKQKH